jgi:hypothetical protein
MRRPYAWESTLLVFVFLLLLLSLNLIFGVIQSFLEQPLVLSPILIFGELLVLIVVIIWTTVRRLSWQETFRLHKTSWSLIGLSFLVAITWWFVGTGLATLMEQLFSLIGPPPEIPPLSIHLLPLVMPSLLYFWLLYVRSRFFGVLSCKVGCVMAFGPAWLAQVFYLVCSTLNSQPLFP